MSNLKLWIGKKVKVIIDRPLGSRHPEYNTVYPVNYGYIPDTYSKIDKEEIDAYILGPQEPLKEFEGKVIALVVREDDESKFIVSNRNYSKKEINKLIDFQERYFISKIVK